MEQEFKAEQMFPNTSFGSLGSGFNESMKGAGLEPVELIREDYCGAAKRGGMPYVDPMQVREVIPFVLEKFLWASEHGGLAATYRHYVRELRRVNVFDEKVISSLEKFEPEVKKAISLKEQKAVFEQIVEYLGKMRMEKR